jgi:hypothetical protein
MYTLAEEINRIGLSAKCICYEKRKADVIIPNSLGTSITFIAEDGIPEINEHDIVIYSDMVSDNPLHANRVVRYLLNRPTVFTSKPIEYGQTDYLVAYSGLISEWLPKLYLLNDDREDIQKYISIQKQNLVSYYFGKVNKSKLRENLLKINKMHHDFSEMRIITRHNPQTKDGLFSLIAKSSLLVSFDPLTNLNYEAALLGTPVLLVDDAYNTRGSEFSHGVIYDYKDYVSCRFQRKNYFFDYSKRIADQIEDVMHFVNDVENHFNKINNNADYVNQRSYVIAQQRQCDKLFLKARSFINPTSYWEIDDLPIFLRVGLEGYGWKSVYHSICLLLHYIHNILNRYRHLMYNRYRWLINSLKKKLQRDPKMYNAIMKAYYILNCTKWPKAFRKYK